MLWLHFQAGAGGFRDFPPLPAAKENRNGSRRTLPVSPSGAGKQFNPAAPQTSSPFVVLLDLPGKDVVCQPCTVASPRPGALHGWLRVAGSRSAPPHCRESARPVPRSRHRPHSAAACAQTPPQRGQASAAWADSPELLRSRAAFSAPQSECPQTITCLTFNTSTAYSIVAVTPSTSSLSQAPRSRCCAQ